MQLTLLGSGNVATVLGNACLNAGHKIVQVYGRNLTTVNSLAKQLNGEPIDDLKNINQISDVYLFCLSDDSIAEVAKQISFPDLFCVHTSGSISLDSLKNKFFQSGVLYPLQTISANRTINLADVPLCIEASDKDAEEKLKSLAKSLSSSVHHINSQHRLFLHLAAVFANNFTNCMYATAADILKEQNLSFRLLYPLMMETTLKAMDADPQKVQTGPAVRNDHHTINKHLELMANNDNLKRIYQLLTEQIQQQKKIIQ